jgi:hypothetical protein
MSKVNVAGKFLIRVGDEFFCGFDKKSRPMTVPLPSVATHLSYAQADIICQQLREYFDEKFVSPCVTDRLGRYADLEVIQHELNVDVKTMLAVLQGVGK